MSSSSPKTGVLLINLGTPDAPDAASVRRYLAEFLSDRRVVELPAILWQPILRGIVLATRPAKSAHAYRLIWMEDGSPLAVHTAAQARGLAGAFGPGVTVDHAMRYGRPSIPARLKAMKDAGCERILLAPLYPQYCAATTATALDKAYAVLGTMRWQPAIRTLPPYYADASYIAALKASAEQGIAALDFAPDLIVASFHGMPVRTETLGDPYRRQCLATARLLSQALGREVRSSFQSRFGSAKWFEPATDRMLAGLPAAGVKQVAVLCPGFSADCIETLEEINIRGRATFLEAGGTHFAYLPCLNASESGLAMLKGLLARELAGWVVSAG